MIWRVTIDQQASMGGTQRFGPMELEGTVVAVVAQALRIAGLANVEAGDYQLTVEALPF